MNFVFDAYGTLFDINAAARDAANDAEMGALRESWQTIAQGWRERQLRYSWLGSMMGRYEDFWTLTVRALDATLQAHDLNDDAVIRDQLLGLYRELSAFDEVRSVLQQLKQQGDRTAVFSNASPAMLEDALKASALLPWLDEIISVDVLKKYKPTPETYALVTDRFQCAPRDVIFFSSNNWDVSGAANFGFRTVWVNRSHVAWDALVGAPEIEAPSLQEGIDQLSR